MTNSSFNTDDHDLTVCIPTLNEEESIGEVVEEVQENGYEPLVIDGGSTDNTQSIVEQKGGVLVDQSYSGGKGAAVFEVMKRIEDNTLVLLDGDCTYEPNHIDGMVEAVREDDFDQVIGNRFDNMEKNAMSKSHVFGNKCANLAFKAIIGEYLVDILSGFRALDLRSFNVEDINSRGFDIETELCAYSVFQDHRIKIMDTNYYERKGESKLGEVSDSTQIIKRMIRCRIEMSDWSR